MNPKITEHHRSKPAYVYVRQSTLAQVRHHQESTERQYALREKAQELGWSEPAIRILDRDLGMSGALLAFKSPGDLSVLSAREYQSGIQIP